jgi:hypothetical protein
VPGGDVHADARGLKAGCAGDPDGSHARRDHRTGAVLSGRADAPADRWLFPAWREHREAALSVLGGIESNPGDMFADGSLLRCAPAAYDRSPPNTLIATGSTLACQMPLLAQLPGRVDDPPAPWHMKEVERATLAASGSSNAPICGFDPDATRPDTR